MSVAPVSVLIPMKRFALAKSRLQSQLMAADRAQLARSMFERVLHAASRCDHVAETWVLTNGDDVAELARQGGARLLVDPPQLTAALGDLIDWSLAQLSASGVRRVLVLMADLPYLETADVAELIERLDHTDIVLSPDRSGRCTNALGLHLPFAGRTAFGDPESYALHLQRARELGLHAAEVANPRLAHDVDTPDDLPKHAPPSRPTGSVGTGGVPRIDDAG